MLPLAMGIGPCGIRYAPYDDNHTEFGTYEYEIRTRCC